MAQTGREMAPDVDQLNERIRMLEERVSALEDGAGKQRTLAPSLIAETPPSLRPPETGQGFPPIEIPSVVSTIGKAVLGIAGAYLLRAVAESDAVPKVPVLIAAIAYAALWLVWAVRTHGDRFTSVTYGVTSILILSPMLWESTVRFEFVSPAGSGITLVAFLALALLLAWKRDLQVIPWLATAATTVTALALIVATHDLVPLTAAILAIALAVEAAVCFGHFLTLRVVPAIAGNIAVWLVLDLMTSREGIPEGYKPASPATIVALWFILLAIYVGSIGIRAFWLRRRITAIDVGQGTIAFLLAIFGAIRAPHGLVPSLGFFYLLLAAACYWGALSRFADLADERDRRVSANWAAILLIAGTVLLFSPTVGILFLCAAAVVMSFAYTRTMKISLGLHASLFIAAAALVSNLLNYAASALAGVVPPAPDWRVVVVACSAALCYLIGALIPGVVARRPVLWILPTAIVGVFAAGVAVTAIVGVAGGHFDLSASRLSVIRTIMNYALALTFGFLRLKWKRVELGWLAYAAVGFGTLKLLFEDLRFGNTQSLVVSLLFYGLVLIGLPRLIRRQDTGNLHSSADSVLP